MSIKKKSDNTYDYNTIPLGFYDEISFKNKGMRSFWHNHKFERVIDCIAENQGSILDIGCFSGTFLSKLSESKFQKQIGVDILPEQVAYANEKYGTSFRSFQCYKTPNDLLNFEHSSFDYITIIEVIEHLTKEEISNLIKVVEILLKPGGTLIITTPNYRSIWPLLEFGLNKLSSVQYEEQHITKFSFHSFVKQMNKYSPLFSKKFKTDFITTTHFLTPFIAIVASSFARKISTLAPHKKWQFPFGSLILTKFTRTTE